MHDYYFRVEVIRVGLVLGVIVTILFYERFQLTAGGSIVPGYLVAFLPQPVFILATVGAGLLTYLLVNRVIARRVILYGRRRFEVEILTGLGIVAVLTAIALPLSDVDPALTGLVGVGFLIPGILAHDMLRQRPRTTLVAVASTTAILAMAVYLFAFVLAISPVATEAPVPLTKLALGYRVDLLLPAVVISVAIGLVLYARLGIRSGGFITAAYLALVITRPWDLVFAAVVGLATFVVVTRVVMPRAIVFGRRKLSAMIVVGSVLAWTSELVVVAVFGEQWHPWQGFVLMTLMAPSLLANDAQRQGIEKTLWGATITTLGVYGVMNLLEAALTATGHAA